VTLTPEVVMSNLVSLRVWGDFACFTRPEMKVERVSYRVPTPSAARGALEAVLWEPQMHYLIDRITVVRPGHWFSFRRNEVGKVFSIDAALGAMAGKKPIDPVRAGGGAADAVQRNMLALTGVEYVFTAEVRLTDRADRGRDNIAKYVEQFRTRAAKGKCAHRPALGCREFAADFELIDGPDVVSIQEPLTEDLGLMLYDVFDPKRRASEANVEPRPVFFMAKIDNGRMDCHPDRVSFVRPGTGV
jgi:CRISPR-associated protein Cas5d